MDCIENPTDEQKNLLERIEELKLEKIVMH